MAHTCQPMRLRTGTVPSRTPRPSNRTATIVRRARVPNPTAVASGTTRSARAAASRSVSVPRTATPTTATPASAATSGRHDMANELNPYTATHRHARGGRSSGHGALALPFRSAGEPDHRSPFGTRPATAEPASTSASRPM